MFLQSPQEPQSPELQTVQRTGRGRARFTQTSEYSEFVQSTDDPAERKAPSRRKLDYERQLFEPRNFVTIPTTTRKSGPGLYEVSEALDDVPDLRKRPRVITEQSFEIKNKKEFTPDPVQTTISETVTPKLEKEETSVLTTDESDTTPVSSTESPTSKLFTSETTTTATTKEPQRTRKTDQNKQPASVPDRRQLPRAQLRSRPNVKVEEPTTTARALRGRQSRRQQDTNTPTTTVAPELNRSRNVRRRPVPNTQPEIPKRGSLSLENEHEHPTRSRSGRKTEQRSSRRSDSVEDIEIRDISRSKRLHTASSRRTETKIAADPTTEQSKTVNRGRGRARSNLGQIAGEVKTENIQPRTFPSRRTSKDRNLSRLDETKLEVLPLFESENKTERITAVDSIPDVTTKVIPESTTPLQTTTKSTTGKVNRRFPPRTKEVKNNKIEETRSRSNRRPNTEATVTENPRRNDRRKNSANRETSTIKTFPSRNAESTTESRRKFERVKPKRVEPVLSENRLQKLAPRRASRRKDTLPVTLATQPTTTTQRGRVASKSSEKEVEHLEDGAETSVTRSVEKFDEQTIKDTKKRGTIKDDTAEDSVEESDNYPVEFKAIIQASKLKVSYLLKYILILFNSRIVQCTVYRLDMVVHLIKPTLKLNFIVEICLKFSILYSLTILNSNKVTKYNLLISQ